MPDPDFWRTEIWHPLSVHFPIALLLLSTLMKLVAVGIKKDYHSVWWNAGSGILFSGCLVAWLSVYTGDMADPIVSRVICDPTVLKSHENTAYYVAYLFSVASILDLVSRFNLVKNSFLTVTRSLIILLMLAGSAYLVYTAHLGATLVYQQGAGVKDFSSDCADYK